MEGGQILRYVSRLIGAVPWHRPTLAVALGAHYCRCAIVRKEGEQVGPDSVRKVLTERVIPNEEWAWLAAGPNRSDTVKPCSVGPATCLGVPPTPDERVLARLLTNLRLISGLPKRPKPRVVVTARVDLLAAVELHLPAAAPQAGFWSWRTVPEHACIAAAVGAGPKNALIVDLGHTGSRAWVYSEGRPVPDSYAKKNTAGGAMVSAVIAAVQAHYGLLIGTRTAEDLLTSLDSAADWPMEVHAKDRGTGLPRRAAVARNIARDALKPVLDEIACFVSETHGRDPSPARIVIAGGAADSEDLLQALVSRLHHTVELRPSPGDLSVIGLGKVCGSDATGAARWLTVSASRLLWCLTALLVVAAGIGLLFAPAVRSRKSPEPREPHRWAVDLLKPVTEKRQATSGAAGDWPLEITAVLKEGENVWVGTKDHGLFRWDRSTDSWTEYLNTDIGERIERIWADDGRVWVEHGTWGSHTYCYVDYTDDRGATWNRFLWGDAGRDYVHTAKLTNAGLRSERLGSITQALCSGVEPDGLVQCERAGEDVLFTIYVNSEDGWCRMYCYNLPTDTLTDLAIAEQKGGGVGVRQFYIDPYDHRFVWILSGEYGGPVQVPCRWFRFDRSSGALHSTDVSYAEVPTHWAHIRPDGAYADRVDFRRRRSGSLAGP